MFLINYGKYSHCHWELYICFIYCCNIKESVVLFPVPKLSVLIIIIIIIIVLPGYQSLASPAISAATVNDTILKLSLGRNRTTRKGPAEVVVAGLWVTSGGLG
ncbi:hypothetical protein XELAEV_18013911mg [Xenopus laevis]|uniref:Uncharacterized protein n=1 Tax=Xenopus laevis TaxID=8355 RepID=A0A974DS64_XENLA|nr:hypothetical protein XELAEV_18013911mg [Xenopus laevis]